MDTRFRSSALLAIILVGTAAEAYLSATEAQYYCSALRPCSVEQGLPNRGRPTARN